MVEHNLAKVGVASSSLVSRSNSRGKPVFPLSCFRLGGRVVMQRPAKPSMPVRFRPQPPHPCSYAQVAKSVDARDLKSLGFGRAGSSPALGTTLIVNELQDNVAPISYGVIVLISDGGRPSGIGGTNGPLDIVIDIKNPPVRCTGGNRCPARCGYIPVRRGRPRVFPVIA